MRRKMQQKMTVLWRRQCICGVVEHCLFLFLFLLSFSWIALFYSAAMDYFLFFPPLRFHCLASLSFLKCNKMCSYSLSDQHFSSFINFPYISFGEGSHGLGHGAVDFLSILYTLRSVKCMEVKISVKRTSSASSRTVNSNLILNSAPISSLYILPTNTIHRRQDTPLTITLNDFHSSAVNAALAVFAQRPDHMKHNMFILKTVPSDAQVSITSLYLYNYIFTVCNLFTS